MAETFTGKLEWITMGGNIDVRHPDGRVVRCYSMTADHSREADRLGRNAFVTVEIPNDVPGRGKLDPRILAVSETPSPQPRVSVPAALKGDEPAGVGVETLRIAWEMGRKAWCPAAILEDHERTERDWQRALAALKGDEQ